MGELMGKGRLNPDGNMGFAAILSFSSSASCSLLALALRFWNQILTWVSVRLRELENSALSAMERYCFWRNLRSRASSWEVVNGVRGFLFVLCFLRVQAVGLRCPARKGKAGYHKRRETWCSGEMRCIWGLGQGVGGSEGKVLTGDTPETEDLFASGSGNLFLAKVMFTALQQMSWEVEFMLSDFKRAACRQTEHKGFTATHTAHHFGSHIIGV